MDGNRATFSFAELADRARPSLMGIVNVTPDSFSDGRKFFDPAAAAGHAKEMVREGAGIVDLGAEASSFFRAGVLPTEPGEQIRRLLPVIELLRDLPAEIAMSVDTRSAAVARAVLHAGGHEKRRWIINDISAGTHDAEMFRAVAEAGAAMILMHIGPGYPKTPAGDDGDILATVRGHLLERLGAAVAAGIAPEQIALDPGIGFGKTMADNWRLAMRGGEVVAPVAAALDKPVIVIGASRKRFLETPPPADVGLPPDWPGLLEALQRSEESSHPRDAASAALTAVAARRGAFIHRVHNITLARHALEIFRA